MHHHNIYCHISCTFNARSKLSMLPMLPTTNSVAVLLCLLSSADVASCGLKHQSDFWLCAISCPHTAHQAVHAGHLQASNHEPVPPASTLSLTFHSWSAHRPAQSLL